MGRHIAMLSIVAALALCGSPSRSETPASSFRDISRVRANKLVTEEMIDDVVEHLLGNHHENDIYETSSSRNLRRERLMYQFGTGCTETVDFSSGRREALRRFLRSRPRQALELDHHRRRLSTQNCSAYPKRPQIRAGFCGLFTNSSGVRLPLFADTFRNRYKDESGTWIPIKFFETEAHRSEWISIPTFVDRANRSITTLTCDRDGACGETSCCPPSCADSIESESDCRDKELSRYFLFPSKASNATRKNFFPRIDAVRNTTLTQMDTFLSAATANAGPLIMSFAYDHNSSGWDDNYDAATDTYYPNCFWTPYQIVAWVIPQNPTIEGFVEGGAADDATTFTPSPSRHPFIFTDSDLVTLVGENFDPDATANAFIFRNEATDWTSAVASAKTTSVTVPDFDSQSCDSGVQRTWTPGFESPPTITSSTLFAHEENTWAKIGINEMSPLNGGVMYNILESNQSGYVHAPFTTSTAVPITCQATRAFENFTSMLGDGNISTTYECANATYLSGDGNWTLEIDMCNQASCNSANDYVEFEARSIRVATTSVSENNVPSAEWYFEGYSSEDGAWMSLLQLNRSDWYVGDGPCYEWGVPHSIPAASRDFYEKYRIRVPENQTNCCHISELEINGVDATAWVEAVSIVSTSTGATYTSPVRQRLFVLEPATPNITEDVTQPLQVALEEVSDAIGGATYPIYIYGRGGFGALTDGTVSSNRVIVHLFQKITAQSCCTAIAGDDFANRDARLLRMQRFLKSHARYIDDTEGATQSATCADNSTTITCYFGASNDAWTQAHDTVCPCNATVQSVTSDNNAKFSTTLLNLRSWWFGSGATEKYSFTIQENVYASVEILGAERMSEIVGVATCQGKPGVVATNATIKTSVDRITIAGSNFGAVASRNSVSFRPKAKGQTIDTCWIDCFSTNETGSVVAGNLSDTWIPITGYIESATTEELVFAPHQLLYASGNNAGNPIEVEAQVSVEGISAKSDWTTVFSLESAGPEIIEMQGLHDTSQQLITLRGFGLAPLETYEFPNDCCSESDCTNAQRVVGCVPSSTCSSSSCNVSVSATNSLVLSQNGEGSTYNTDRSVAGTIPDIVAPVVASTRTHLVLSFASLSPFNQDSYQSGDVRVAVTLQHTFQFGYSTESTFRSSVDAANTSGYTAFSVRASDPLISSYVSNLTSTTTKLTILGTGFDTTSKVSVVFDSSLASATVHEATYSTVVLSFTKLSATTAGDLRAIVSIPDSYCWETNCTNECSNTPNIANMLDNVTCDGTSAFGSCTYSCINSSYVPSSSSVPCSGTGEWDTTGAGCLSPCESIIPPINGGTGTCAASLRSGESCAFTCNAGTSLGNTTCTNGTINTDQCLTDCDLSSLAAPTNGGLGTCTGTLGGYGQTCSFACNSGFTVSSTITCTNGTLVPSSLPTCDANCSVSVIAAVPVPGNATTGTCNVSLASGESCAYECASGFLLSGSSYCADGVFSSNATCSRCVNCTCAFEAPANGGTGTCGTTIASGASCLPTCNIGYSASAEQVSCVDGILSHFECVAFESDSDYACDFLNGYTYNNRLWSGCMAVQNTARGYGSNTTGTCISPKSLTVSCRADCKDTCSSALTAVARVLPDPPIITATPTVDLRCTDMHLTISGRAFDADAATNNEVNLILTTSTGQTKNFTGTCSVTSSSYTQLVCLYDSLSCSEIDATSGARDKLSVQVRIRYNGVNVTSWSSSAEVGFFTTSNPVVVASTVTLACSSSYVTIWGNHFDFLTPANNRIDFEASRGTSSPDSDIPTGFAVSSWRDTNDTIANVQGYVVVEFYKLGPSNIGAELKALVQLINTGVDASAVIDFTKIQVATITSGTVVVSDTNTQSINTSSTTMSIVGSGFDPYNYSANNIAFVSSAECDRAMAATAISSTRTHMTLSIHRISPLSYEHGYIEANYIQAQVSVSQQDSGEALPASALRTIARLTVVPPTLDAMDLTSANAILSSDTLLLTINGFGFDNTGPCGDCPSGGSCTRGNSFNVVNFTAERLSEDVKAYVHCASRSTLKLSFDKLDARHVGNLTAVAGFKSDATTCGHSTTHGPYSTAPENVASIVGADPFISVLSQRGLPSVDVEPGQTTLEFLITGTGFVSSSSTPNHNYVKDLDYVGEFTFPWCGLEEPQPTGCTSDFMRFPIEATRTRLTMRLGPFVRVDNAGDVSYVLAASGYQGGRVVNATSGSNYTTGDSPEFVIEIGKGDPTMFESTSDLRSDGTCLLITGENFETTSHALIVNERLASTTASCNNVTRDDLKQITSNCTSACDSAYWSYRDFDLPTYSSTDTSRAQCGMWPDIESIYNVSAADGQDIKLDLISVDFQCAANSGSNNPVGRVLYSSSNEVCVYMDTLAPQNVGDLRATIYRYRYSYNVTSNATLGTTSYSLEDDGNPVQVWPQLNCEVNDPGNCTVGEGGVLGCTCCQRVANVAAVAPTLSFDTSDLHHDTEYLTIRGTGFDKTAQTMNEIVFVNPQVTASIHPLNQWSDATRSTLRFEFWRLGAQDAGLLNASVSVMSNVSDATSALNSSTNTVANVVAVSPTLNQTGTILQTLTSGTDVSNLTLRGRGFDATPLQSRNLLRVFDLEGGAYTNFASDLNAPVIYALDVANATRTTLDISFPTLHRNSTRINPMLAPFSAEMSVDGGTNFVKEAHVAVGTDSDGRGYAFYGQLFRSCIDGNVTCNNGTCYDIIEAPITLNSYVCECASIYFGGERCEITLTTNQVRCSERCLSDMSECKSAYLSAATGYNDEQTAGFVVSLLTYVEQYLHNGDSEGIVYSLSSVPDINAFSTCWLLSNRSNTAATPVWQSAPVTHVINLATTWANVLVDGVGDIEWLFSYSVLFGVSFLLACIGTATNRLFELV